MRILLLNQFYYPDIAATAQLCTDWAEDLAARGFSVTVLCGSGRYRQPHLGREPEALTPLPSDELHNGVRIVRVPVRDAPPPISASPSKREQLSRLLGRASGYGQFLTQALWTMQRLPSPDVVVALTTPPLVGALGLCASRLSAAKLVLWVQDVYPDLLLAMGLARPESTLYRALSLFARTLYRSADRIIALDEAMADRLLDAGASAAQLVTIDHFASARELTPQPRQNSLRAELGLTDEFVVCYAGNHGRGHDFDTIIEAIRVQSSSLSVGPPIHWLFVGDGDEKARLLASVPSNMRGLVHALEQHAEPHEVQRCRRRLGLRFQMCCRLVTSDSSRSKRRCRGCWRRASCTDCSRRADRLRTSDPRADAFLRCYATKSWVFRSEMATETR